MVDDVYLYTGLNAISKCRLSLFSFIVFSEVSMGFRVWLLSVSMDTCSYFQIIGISSHRYVRSVSPVKAHSFCNDNKKK